jgi:hypothetical protein
MKLKRTFELLAVKTAGNLILAGTVILAAVCITLVTMTVMVTVGTVFGLSLPYKSITALVALAVMVVLIVLSVKYQKNMASVGHEAPDPRVGQNK